MINQISKMLTVDRMGWVCGCSLYNSFNFSLKLYFTIKYWENTPHTPQKDYNRFVRRVGWDLELSVMLMVSAWHTLSLVIYYTERRWDKMINPFSSYNLWVRVVLGEPETWHAWAGWEARPHDTETKWTERSQVAATDIRNREVCTKRGSETLCRNA